MTEGLKMTNEMIISSWHIHFGRMASALVLYCIFIFYFLFLKVIGPRKREEEIQTSDFRFMRCGL